MKQIKELMNLSGRRAVITGGTGFFGRAFSNALAELGADIVFVDIDQKTLDKTANELQDKWDVSVDAFKCDLESEEERNELILSLKNLSNIDILINNAAFAGTTNLQGWVEPFEKQTVDTWRRAIEVNLTAVFHLTKDLMPELSLNGDGSVINISSIYGVVAPDMSLYDGTAMGNPAAYSASKGGLIQLTRWLSTNMAPQVRVNCISPGGVERGQPEIFQDRYTKKTPLGRMATEQDMIGTIVYLASDLSGYVTGQNIIVDGGWCSW